VMCDTFRPLKLTTLARDLDDPSYAYSWYQDEPGQRQSRDQSQVSGIPRSHGARA
jgi:hypothetical protein